MPKTTVVIPVYNAEKYLRECLDSVLGQTLRDIEVICVDDGSTDASAQILSEYAAKDARVRIFRQANSGAGAARNRALDEARGDSVVFIDPDDYYPDSSVLEKLYRALVESGNDLAAGTMRRVPESDPRAAKFNAGYASTKAFPHGGTVTLEEYQSPFRYQCFMYHIGLFRDGGIRFPLWRRFQDPPFLARCLVKAGKFFAIADCVYCYRLPEVGESVNWTADDYMRLREFFGGFNELLDIAEQNGCRKMYKAAADSFARAHRFDGLSPAHPLWREATLACRRMARSGWLTTRNMENIFRFMYGAEWGKSRVLLMFRIFGAVGGLRLLRRWWRTKR